jgi:hypothetical protein
LIPFLCVTVPPEKLVIVDEEGTERTSVVGPYSEGADLALRCDVYGGKYACHALVTKVFIIDVCITTKHYLRKSGCALYFDTSLS